MQSVLVIGAGGVSHVTIHKMARLSKVFSNIILVIITLLIVGLFSGYVSSFILKRLR